MAAIKKSKKTKIRPEYREGESDSLTRHWRDLFLDILAETSNVSEAARVANINPRRAYKIRREEPKFARQWFDALLEGYEHLELETLYRLRNGTTKDGSKFDITNALRLLMMHRETVARERALRSSSSEADVRAAIDAKIALMRSRETGGAGIADRTGPGAFSRGVGGR